MAAEQRRLLGSDITKCFVAFSYYDQTNPRLYYPQPTLSGFRSILGDGEMLRARNREAWSKAEAAGSLAREWDAIFKVYDRKGLYTADQLRLIEQKITKAKNKQDRAAEEYFTALKDQEELDEFAPYRDDLLSALKGLEQFNPFANVDDVLVKSSYKLDGNKLIIVHAAIDTTREQTPENSADLILAELQRQGVDLNGVEVTHLIPEGGEGRMDGLFGVKHIRLRVAQGNPIDMGNSQLIDPRDIHQSTFDTVNCGRYVTTMIGQAVGLHSAGLAITREALKASPIVANADKFSTDEALQEASLFASEHPVDIGAQHNELERILAELEQLNETYKLRAEQGLEYNHWWGSFFGGYKASEKQRVTQKILDSRSVNLEELENEIAGQGELGKLVNQLKDAMEKDGERPEEKPSINSAR